MPRRCTPMGRSVRLVMSRSMRSAASTLLTDFGRQDTYVGVIRGVIAAPCPEATVIDLCHELIGN